MVQNLGKVNQDPFLIIFRELLCFVLYRVLVLLVIWLGDMVAGFQIATDLLMA